MNKPLVIYFKDYDELYEIMEDYNLEEDKIRIGGHFLGLLEVFNTDNVTYGESSYRTENLFLEDKYVDGCQLSNLKKINNREKLKSCILLTQDVYMEISIDLLYTFLKNGDKNYRILVVDTIGKKLERKVE